MADILAEQPAAAEHSPEIPPKRRKVRKGTRSCWECKRRKIRCVFASSDYTACFSCQRLRTPCVSQEMPEGLSPARNGNRHLTERIARVEDFVQEFLANKHSSTTSQIDLQAQQVRESSGADGLNARSNEPALPSIRAPLTPADSLQEFGQNTLLPTPDSLVISGQSETEATALHHLLEAFPAEEDARLLLRASCRPSLYTELVNTRPHSKLTHESLTTQYPLPELLGPNTHPVILAKCMLIFAITLQSPCGEKVLGLSQSPSVLMSRLMTAVTTWVTTKEEIQGTIDNLICIILEGVFEINSGNLRRAWAVYRRAMAVAQLMGLHRTPMQPLKSIDPGLKADPAFLWFRIVYMDRYLSLLLGLPQGTYDKSMGATSILQLEPPLGKLERQLTVVASRILERNENVFSPNEITTTQSIDPELLRVSKSIPASFWRPPNFHNLTPGSPDTLLETVRLGAQVYYYSLLIQLHLPYMMHGIGDSSGHEYSKITCVNASREIITRFTAHRSFNPMSSCSRPVDFFALLAAMTLLLAHLDAHHHREATNFLAHQRLSDCAILGHALETMDVISTANNDIMMEQSARLIQRLLDIEADAAQGSSYTARRVREQHVDVQEGNKDESEELHLDIPYLGVIKIARQAPISQERSHHTLRLGTPQREFTASNNGFTSLPRATLMNDQAVGSHQHITAQRSTFPSHLPTSEQINAPLQTTSYDVQSMLQCPISSGDGIPLQPDVEPPTTVACVDDWVFQGVDMAFFDSLMRTSSGVDADELALNQ